MSSFSINLLVGIPLAHFPWMIASALPFLATTFLVAALGTFQMLRSIGTTEFRTRLVTTLVSFTFMSVSWWSYWWMFVDKDSLESENFAIALAVTHWQNIGAGAVVPLCTLIWGWLILEKKSHESRSHHRLHYLLLGLIAGFTGTIIATASVAMLLILFFVSACSSHDSSREMNMINRLVTLVGAVLGTTASYLSPGSQTRASLFKTPKLDTQFLHQLWTEALPKSINDFRISISHPSALVLIACTCFFSLTIASPEKSTHAKYLFRKSIGLLTFSFVMFFLVRTSQFFVYEGFWHLVAPRTTAWLALSTLGMSMGVHLSQYRGMLSLQVAACIGIIIGVYLMTGSLTLMQKSIIDRSEQWEVGPAPVYDTSDIEDPNGWVLPNWLELKKLRGGPSRALP